jgi:hypothetical protein
MSCPIDENSSKAPLGKGIFWGTIWDFSRSAKIPQKFPPGKVFFGELIGTFE